MGKVSSKQLLNLLLVLIGASRCSQWCKLTLKVFLNPIWILGILVTLDELSIFILSNYETY